MDNDFLIKACKYFGWTGGTIHQAKREVRKEANKLYLRFTVGMIEGVGGHKKAQEHAEQIILSEIFLS